MQKIHPFDVSDDSSSPSNSRPADPSRVEVKHSEHVDAPAVVTSDHADNHLANAAVAAAHGGAAAEQPVNEPRVFDVKVAAIQARVIAEEKNKNQNDRNAALAANLAEAPNAAEFPYLRSYNYNLENSVSVASSESDKQERSSCCRIC